MTAAAGGRSRWIYVLILVWLGIGRGSTQPLGKIATTGGHGPFGLILWQLVVCLAVLGPLIPNATFCISVTRLPSGGMPILIWAMLLPGERFSPLIWLALVVMLAGVALVQPRRRPVVQEGACSV